MTAAEILKKIDELAPFDTQESYDNAGLLVGDPSLEVTGILTALDVTQPVIDEAIRTGANLIVTHHPLMFSPIRRVTAQTYEGQLIMRLIREGITLIAAHTNLDRAPEGVSMTLARRCGLTDIEGDSFLRIGTLPQAKSAAALAAELQGILGDTIRVMGESSRMITRLAVVSGAGSDFAEEAIALGADALLTGEVKHHHALNAANSGMVILEAGHWATENPGVIALTETLQNWINTLQYGVRVTAYEGERYGFPVPLG